MLITKKVVVTLELTEVEAKALIYSVWDIANEEQSELAYYLAEELSHKLGTKKPKYCKEVLEEEEE